MSAGSSQTAPASVFPNLVPAAVVTSGDVIACASSAGVRRISSIPAVMFPHWSLPPICNRTSWRRRSSRKSYAWSSMYENSVYEIPASMRPCTESFCIM